MREAPANISHCTVGAFRPSWVARGASIRNTFGLPRGVAAALSDLIIGESTFRDRYNFRKTMRGPKAIGRNRGTEWVHVG
jgi:hypothetical protein